MLLTSVCSLTLRLFTLASKFFLMLYMAKFLEPHDLGVYGMFLTVISLSIYLLGFDFYSYTSREILSTLVENQVLMVRDQLVFHAMLYVIVLPMLLLVFINNYIDWKYCVIFYMLLFVEHVSHELQRLLVTLGRPVASNIVLFMRSGAWIYVLLVVVSFDERYIETIDHVLTAWCIGASVNIVMSIFFMRGYSWGKVTSQPINWRWIWRGLRTSRYFFVATMGYQLILYLDRFIIKENFGEDLLGIYTFYWSFANIIQIFVFAGITSLYHPQIIKSYKENRVAVHKQLLRSMTKLSLATSIVLGIALAIFMPKIISFVDKNLYLEYISFYYMLIISMIILVASKLPQYGLYVRNMDKQYMLVILMGVLISSVLNFTLVPMFSLYASGAVMLVVTFSVFLLNITILARRLRQENPNSL